MNSLALSRIERDLIGVQHCHYNVMLFLHFGASKFTLTSVEGDVVGSSGHDHHASTPLKVVI